MALFVLSFLLSAHCIVIPLLPPTPNQFLHETMSTPKEAAELIAKKRRGKDQGKDGSSSTPTRHSLRQNSAANSREHSPAQGKGSTPTQKNKPSGIDGNKSPPKIHKSPPHQSQSPTNNDEDEAAENGGQDNDDDKDFPDYNGRVVSYNDPQSQRPGHGMVGDYIQDEKGYHVTFKYTDDLDPKECVDYCPRYWIEESLVDTDAANFWKSAMENAKLLDSPTSKQHKNPPLLPAKRPRDQTKRFEPDAITTKTKTRKAPKKSNTSLGAGLSNLHLQSTLLMTSFSRNCICCIFNDHLRSP